MHSLISLVKREPSLGLTVLFQLFVLTVGSLGTRLQIHHGFLWILTIVGISGLIAWWIATSRKMQIQNTPLSSISSAAQGYVKLAGYGVTAPGFKLVKVDSKPAVWHRIETDQRIEGEDYVWDNIGSEEFSSPFLLQDETSQCFVNIDKAEKLGDYEETEDADLRYRSWTIYADQTIYVMGNFSSKIRCIVQDEKKKKLQELLKLWKKNPAKLLQRFDANQDGQISLHEWENVQKAANAEIEQQQTELSQEPAKHRIDKGQSGKIFLVSSYTPEKLIRYYQLWSYYHGAVFLITLTGIGFLISKHSS